MDQLALSFAGFIMGALGYTFYSFIWKLMENPELVFDKRYLLTMLLSILLTIITSPMLFLTVQIPTTPEGTLYLLLTSFGLGFTANALTNRPVTFLTKKTAVAKVKEDGPEK